MSVQVRLESGVERLKHTRPCDNSDWHYSRGRPPDGRNRFAVDIGKISWMNSIRFALRLVRKYESVESRIRCQRVEQIHGEHTTARAMIPLGS